MTFAGLDIHKKVIEACLIDENGEIVLRERFAATHEEIVRFAKQHLNKNTKVAIEATTNSWAIAGLLQPYVQSVVVSNPMATKAIATSRVKTDKVDAFVLAQLLRAGFLPTIWIPDDNTRQLRSLCTERANLTADRTAVKNRVHAILHQRLIVAPEGDLFSKENLKWLKKLDLDPLGQQALDRQLFFLDMISTEADMFGNQLAEIAYKSPEANLLMTIPGVDFPTALTILAQLGDWNRFADGDKAAAYFGLVPSTKQSADKCYHGPITKRGKGHARWMLVQAAQHLDVHPGPVGNFFRRIANKKNRNVAVVATAKKLVVIAWNMLKNGEPYRYGEPKATAAKLSRLRVRATGEKRKGGNPKGQPRPKAYGSGKPTRGIDSLDTVYRKENIPPLLDFKPAEQRMLRAQGLEEFAASIRQSRRVPRSQAASKA